MQDWTTYKRAALEYSKMRPRSVTANITLVAADKDYALPADCLTVRAVEWGDVEISFTEAITSTSADKGWAVEAGMLYLTPAPTAADVTATPTIKIIYDGRYIPNDSTLVFTPPLPATDVHHVDDLEQSILLEVEADDVAKGPAVYSIGQTQVSRAEALAYLLGRARELRSRVRAAIEDPLAIWS